jgi:hypothetical protein
MHVWTVTASVVVVTMRIFDYTHTGVGSGPRWQPVLAA